MNKLATKVITPWAIYWGAQEFEGEHTGPIAVKKRRSPSDRCSAMTSSLGLQPGYLESIY